MPNSKEDIREINKSVKSIPITHNLMWQDTKWKGTTFICKPDILTMSAFQQNRTMTLPVLDKQEEASIIRIQYQFQSYINNEDPSKLDYSKSLEERFLILLEKLQLDSEMLEGIVQSYTSKNILMPPFYPINNKEDLANFIKVLYWVEQDIRFNLNNAHLLTDTILMALRAFPQIETDEQQRILSLVKKVNAYIKEILIDYDIAFTPLQNYIQAKKEYFFSYKYSQRGNEKHAILDQQLIENYTSLEKSASNKSDKKLIRRKELSQTIDKFSQTNLLKHEESAKFREDFIAILETVNQEGKKLGSPAKEAADKLRLILQCVFKHFTKQEISAEEFRKQCEQAVQVARPTLIGHTGWPTLLDKILFIVLSIATLGIANVVSKATTGSFCFFTGNTVPIEQKLDEISDLSNNPPGMSSI